MSDKPTGVFVRLHDGMLNEKQIAALCNPKRSSTENILTIGTPVTGGEIDYEATVAHYEAKLAERDARIADLENVLQGMIDLSLSRVTCIALARKALKGPEA